VANEELNALDTLIDSWQLAMEVADLAAGTRNLYKRGVNAYREFCADQNIDPVFDKTSVQRYIVACRTDYGRTVSTSKDYLKGVKAFVAWAIEEGEFTSDVKTIKPPELNGAVVLSHVSPEQHQALLDTCDPASFIGKRDLALLRLLKASGCRASEIVGIQLDDLTVRSRRALIHGKGGRDRLIAYDAETALALDRYMRARRAQPRKELPALWLAYGGTRALSYSGFDKMLERRAEIADVGPVHAHMWRHLWARSYLRDGGDRGDLKVLGGWRSNEMVEHYTSEDEADRALEAYDRLYGNRQ
jgi:site-specific recombinase XerD